MVMAIRPDLVNAEGIGQIVDQSGKRSGIFAKELVGGTVQRHGAWAVSVGYTDNPAAATADGGESHDGPHRAAGRRLYRGL